jgi:hypothetical protein
LTILSFAKTIGIDFLYICLETKRKMKRLFTLMICGTALAALSTSCQQCATCTTTSDDPATLGENMTEEVCARGRNYDDLIKIYERGAWTCTAN